MFNNSQSDQHKMQLLAGGKVLGSIPGWGGPFCVVVACFLLVHCFPPQSEACIGLISNQCPWPSADEDLDLVPRGCTVAAGCSSKEDGLNAGGGKFHCALCICVFTRYPTWKNIQALFAMVSSYHQTHPDWLSRCFSTHAHRKTHIEKHANMMPREAKLP